jgi:hypothetical protein
MNPNNMQKNASGAPGTYVIEKEQKLVKWKESNQAEAEQKDIVTMNEDNPFGFFKGCLWGSLLSLPIWIFIIVILVKWL